MTRHENKARRHAQVLLAVLLAMLVGGLLLAAGGCTTLVVTKNADGSVKGELYSFLKDSSADEFNLQTPNVSAGIKGARSDTSAAFKDIAATARSLARAGARAASPVPLPGPVLGQVPYEPGAYEPPAEPEAP